MSRDEQQPAGDAEGNVGRLRGCAEPGSAALRARARSAGARPGSQAGLTNAAPAFAAHLEVNPAGRAGPSPRDAVSQDPAEKCSTLLTRALAASCRFEFARNG